LTVKVPHVRRGRRDGVQRLLRERQSLECRIPRREHAFHPRNEFELGAASAVSSRGCLEGRDITFEVELSPEREFLHQSVNGRPSIHGYVALVEVVRIDPEVGVGKSPGRRDPGDRGLGIERSRREFRIELARERDEFADACSGRCGFGRRRYRRRQRQRAD
jgi:hypothetical protein